MSRGPGRIQAEVLAAVAGGERVPVSTLARRIGASAPYQLRNLDRALRALEARSAIRTGLRAHRRCVWETSGADKCSRAASLTSDVVTSDAFAWLATLPDQSVDACITDPPYDVQTLGMRRGDVQAVKAGSIAFGSINLDALARELVRVCRASMVLIGANSILRAATYHAAMDRAGAHFVADCNWLKTNPNPLKGGIVPDIEYGVGFHRTGAVDRTFRGGATFTCGVPKVRPGGHPTTKPDPLMEHVVALYTRPGDLVIDPFHGSGSTARACSKLGRRYLGCDINQTYAKGALK